MKKRRKPPIFINTKPISATTGWDEFQARLTQKLLSRKS